MRRVTCLQCFEESRILYPYNPKEQQITWIAAILAYGFFLLLVPRETTKSHNILIELGGEKKQVPENGATLVEG